MKKELTVEEVDLPLHDKKPKIDATRAGLAFTLQQCPLLPSPGTTVLFQNCSMDAA